MAKGLGKKADYETYLKRSSNWKNIWNQEAESDGFSGFIMAKKQDGSFDEIDPKEHTDKHFYEGTCWEYSYEIPHDVPGLVEKMGGKQQFVRRLQHAMDEHLINFGNEPSFMTPWLFAHESVQRPDLTSFYIRTELLPLYTRYDLPGDDDQGAMASLYVFARLGLFPFAGTNKYYLHGASFKKATIQLENGKQFIINAPAASPTNIYIKSVRLNKKPFHQSYITQDEIMQGGVLDFEMSSEPVNYTNN